MGKFSVGQPVIFKLCYALVLYPILDAPLHHKFPWYCDAVCVFIESDELMREIQRLELYGVDQLDCIYSRTSSQRESIIHFLYGDSFSMMKNGQKMLVCSLYMLRILIWAVLHFKYWLIYVPVWQCTHFTLLGIMQTYSDFTWISFTSPRIYSMYNNN